MEEVEILRYIIQILISVIATVALMFLWVGKHVNSVKGIMERELKRDQRIDDIEKTAVEREDKVRAELSDSLRAIHQRLDKLFEQKSNHK